MRIRTMLSVAGGAACILSAPAQAMGLVEFLAKADALERRGALAILSSDYRALINEYSRVSMELHRERLQDLREGRPPEYCPREDQQPVTAREALAFFRAIPAQRRERLEVKDAFLALLVQKYPC